MSLDSWGTFRNSPELLGIFRMSSEEKEGKEAKGGDGKGREWKEGNGGAGKGMEGRRWR